MNAKQRAEGIAVLLLCVAVGVGVGAIIWAGEEPPAPTTAAQVRPPPQITLALSSNVWHCIADGRRRGLVVTSTTGGVHARGSYHYISRAADIAGNMRNMLRLQRHLYKTRSRWLEVFGPSGYMSVKRGQPLHLNEGSALARQHDNHVHCAG